jgi:hypothetical protein
MGGESAYQVLQVMVVIRQTGGLQQKGSMNLGGLGSLERVLISPQGISLGLLPAQHD